MTIITEINPASDEAAMSVIMAPVTDDGRSNFFWLWTDDGDRMLACYPRGEMFSATETDGERVG